MIRLESDALVLRTVLVGESDVVATLLTERAGKMAVIARGARKGSHRVGGALEPLHTIGVLVEDKGSDLSTLKEAHIVKLRSALAENLDAFEVAGVALRWARHLFPPRTPEPQGWRILVELLDRLDGTGLGGSPASPKAELACAGLALLSAVGYGLELGQCVICGRPCPEGRSACVDPARGGIVCLACGGASSVLPPLTREAARSCSGGAPPSMNDRSAQSILDLVDRAMAAHAGFER